MMDNSISLEILKLVEQFGEARVWEAACRAARKNKKACKAADRQGEILKRIAALLNAFPETGAPDKMFGEMPGSWFPKNMNYDPETRILTEAIGFETPDHPIADDEIVASDPAPLPEGHG